MTISFWMKTNSYGGTDPNGNWYEGSGLVDAEQAGTHPDWGVSLWQGKIAFGIGAGDQHMGLGEAGSTMISNASVNTNNWVFVAATWDTNGTMNIYIDGVLDSTYTNVNRTDPRDASYTYYIGADSGAFDGNLPEQILHRPARPSGDLQHRAQRHADLQPLHRLGRPGARHLRRARRHRSLGLRRLSPPPLKRFARAFPKARPRAGLFFARVRAHDAGKTPLRTARSALP